MMYGRSDRNGDLDIVDCGCNFIFEIELKRAIAIDCLVTKCIKSKASYFSSYRFSWVYFRYFKYL